MSFNAFVAMQSGGLLTIGTLKENDQVVLCIKDQGSGLNPEIMDRLGTPFVTTKEEGTGLGLAVCYSIAARQNAKIDVETGPGGTTFLDRFPIATRSSVES